jgi:hypothetical protein
LLKTPPLIGLIFVLLAVCYLAARLLVIDLSNLWSVRVEISCLSHPALILPAAPC